MLTFSLILGVLLTCCEARAELKHDVRTAHELRKRADSTYTEDPCSWGGCDIIANSKCIALSEDEIQCVCKEGFVYHKRECLSSYCDAPDICQDGEICVPDKYNISRYSCEVHCEAGQTVYDGICVPHCDVPGICQDGKVCVPDSDKLNYSCVCPDHYTHIDETCVPLCDNDLCVEGLACQAHENGFNCTCNKTKHQECPVTCLDNPCSKGFVCVQQIHELHRLVYECVCDIGYELKNGTCVDIDECRNNPCVPNANCLNTLGSSTCSCPAGTYYNDTSQSCDNFNECLSLEDPCQSKQTGMVCSDTDPGFSCRCPTSFPVEMCEEGSKPCNCGANEKCEEGDEGYHCVCDEESILQDGKCVPNENLPLASRLTLKHTSYNFTVGRIQKIRIQENVDPKTDRQIYWSRVSWVKKPSQVITKGVVHTRPGHFSTPNWRQTLKFNGVMTDDVGDYQVIVRSKGHRTIKQTVHVHVKEPLEKDYGPKEIGKNHWEFKVKLNTAQLEDRKITWYREKDGHLERLKTRCFQLKHRCRKIPGIYIVRLSAHIKGSFIDSEVRFDTTRS